MLKAIENGICSNTTKARSDELVVQKKPLTEKLLIEKSKSAQSRRQMKLKNTYTVQKTPRNLIELIEIFLKYPGEPPANPPHNDNTPDGTDDSVGGIF